MRVRRHVSPSRAFRWPLFVGWATHALALFVWAYLGGLAVHASAQDHHDHAAGHHHDDSAPAPAQRHHGHCPLCPLVAGGAMAPAILVFLRADTSFAPHGFSSAPTQPFARTDVAIAKPRGPPANI